MTAMFKGLKTGWKQNTISKFKPSNLLVLLGRSRKWQSWDAWLGGWGWCLLDFFLLNKKCMIFSGDWLCFDCRGSRRLEDWWLPHHWGLQKLHHCTLLPSLHICHYWGKTTDNSFSIGLSKEQWGNLFFFNLWFRSY